MAWKFVKEDIRLIEEFVNDWQTMQVQDLQEKYNRKLASMTFLITQLRSLNIKVPDAPDPEVRRVFRGKAWTKTNNTVEKIGEDNEDE